MAQTTYGAGITTGPVIEAKNLGVKFAVNRRRKRSLREMFIHGTKRDPNAEGDEFWPLRDVTFDIGRGECVGIVGKNGTGKSTLLKLIAGVLIPDEGEVHVHGKVAPLLELRAGFNDNLTGRENVYLVGSLHGMSEKQIDERFDEIVDFAEIKSKFVDTPVRHYSSGMKVRLGFALISQLEHPIMLVDEVLAVGDKAFKRKCYEAIDRMLANQRTMVLVSHSERDLRRFCNRGLYVKGGGLALDTDIDAALAAYNEDTQAEIEERKKRDAEKKKRAEEKARKAAEADNGGGDGGQAA
ncbi:MULTISPECIES: ABC transporter ATP-binding protein [Nocardiopsis]|jgi:ABC-2 type transport system ATP-binding protein|uniref:ABC transporter related protein n=1 Tax=Nocardiopsis dassonvillei (strain ATCC 23218 / DSM 43111 / CIP 107115 / JCM 7437 / KCTC 9190 / NBRC 14626 / NCTC 10488 / NRRL B-5397 / IMRU 509) TaxID=446468 RepID=D7B6I0_NOCDD|nr:MULTISPECIES: ABC transporter ATP-binding protein [Nocardiopsis]ADH69267.1 ABC transporter related protein [Nocardiopsis dassonvillei subsp. dassonvillei DSM 43111]APC37293.1 sugar ABC transporter [Nocardiopsis dassonvillei]NKY80639.1 ABC transporter ATP-binding protein [Nocardiopsis dassonvillei]VEI89776.1 Teichoic acids export ATP-binding protein TagH [Nocardiopsis dassonvillei]